MMISLRFAFLVMLAVQTVHAIEEFVLEFWNVFPPMRAIYTAPGLGRLVFIGFHSLLIGLGAWGYARYVRRGGESARVAVQAGIAVQSITVLLHAAWFLTEMRFQPGLATILLFLPAIGLASATLRASERKESRG